MGDTNSLMYLSLKPNFFRNIWSLAFLILSFLILGGLGGLGGLAAENMFL